MLWFWKVLTNFSHHSYNEPSQVASQTLQVYTYIHRHFSWTFLSNGERCMRLSQCEAPTQWTATTLGNFAPYSFNLLFSKSLIICSCQYYHTLLLNFLILFFFFIILSFLFSNIVFLQWMLYDKDRCGNAFFNNGL